MNILTRFAPSPTGRLHIGHAYAAWFAYTRAQAMGGAMLLRIEDIDATRCRPAFTAGIIEDLAWLGLSWPEPVRCQSQHMDEYRAALDDLAARELLYPCFCTRREIQDEIARAGHAPHGPEGALYPGTCRALSPAQRADMIASGAPYALRLNLAAALSYLRAQNQWPLTWHDVDRGTHTATPEILGDVVLARKDTPASYHLCVTLDDHRQNITHVTRGEDLLYATHLHRLLQALLGLNVPQWHHHRLLLDENGKRFAKRDHAVTLEHLRHAGHSPEAVWEMLGVTAPA